MSVTDTSSEFLQMIITRNVNGVSYDDSLTSEQLIEKLTELTHIRLDRENLTNVPMLDFIPRLTNLYLQCNSIQEMSNFSCLKELRFLSLAENMIMKIEGISSLTKLGLLDLSDNCIECLKVDELPKSLIILDLSGNMCTKKENYVKENISVHLPKLKSLDGDTVEVLSSSEESEEEDSDDDREFKQVNLNQEAVQISTKNPDKNSGYLNEVTSKISESLNDFSSAMNEKEKYLQSDLVNFLSISESPVPPSDILSDKAITALEKDLNVAPVSGPAKKPLNKRWSPRPPAGAKAKVRNRPVSNKDDEKPTVTRVRTPGARPFRRVVK